MNSLKIAVIGSGISGLSAAWLLSKNHKVTLIEAEDRLGGHTNTVPIEIDGRLLPVDTGFICFNDATYPNLIAFFDHLGVAVHKTTMSFAASLGGGAYEYAGGRWLGMVAQPKNVLRPGHWRMIRDILRFFREAPASLENISDRETIAQYLARNGYCEEFTQRHLLPMAAAIWSSKLEDMLAYPARSLMRFFHNHGLLKLANRPMWRSVSGGARAYIDKVLADTAIDVRTAMPVSRIDRREVQPVIHFQNGNSERFDQVVIATHADQALSLLEQPSEAERDLLGAFDYSPNEAVLHRDPRFMPKSKMAWSSWNYMDWDADWKGGREIARSRDLCVTYWMNSLQQLDTREDVFVTLNPPEDARISNVAGRFHYTHPVFDQKALNAQRQLWSLQGIRNTWFCGAHFGSGFHEDGIQSGLAVAEQLGGMARPWSVENESGRICIGKPVIGLQAAE